MWAEGSPLSSKGLGIGCFFPNQQRRGRSGGGFCPRPACKLTARARRGERISPERKPAPCGSRSFPFQAPCPQLVADDISRPFFPARKPPPFFSPGVRGSLGGSCAIASPSLWLGSHSGGHFLFRLGLRECPGFLERQPRGRRGPVFPTPPLLPTINTSSFESPASDMGGGSRGPGELHRDRDAAEAPGRTGGCGSCHRAGPADI